MKQDQPLHPNDEALIRQLTQDASQRNRAITGDDMDAIRRRSNLMMIVALIGETLARRALRIDTSKYTKSE